MSLSRLIKVDRNDKEVKDTIHRAVEAISRCNFVVTIKLFGSFARNQQNATSDIDLAVVINDSCDLKATMLEVKKLIKGLNWPIDLVVFPESYFNSKRLIGGICFDIDFEGIELYPNWNLK